MNVCIIPARGGSKRIPHKNIKVFCGKPMITYSIDAACKSGCFDRIIVSTDDAKIAAVAEHYGAEVPFIRPPELSNDHAGTVPVIKHAVEWLSDSIATEDYVCCLYATAPFVRPEDLTTGLDLLCSTDVEFVFSVTSFEFPIQRAITITDAGRVKMLHPEYSQVRGQDLEETYHDAGQFYWGKASAWCEEKPLFAEYSKPLILPRDRVQDIDTLEDWRRAELMFKILKNMQDEI